ncbi:hypothetical protein [Ferviditalea candida]
MHGTGEIGQKMGLVSGFVLQSAMTGEDILQVCVNLPSTKVIAVHMDSWNH